MLLDLDLVAKAGPRALTPNVSLEVRKEIAKAGRFERFRRAAEYCARLRHWNMHRQHAAVAQDIQTTEWKATDGLGVPYMRIPQEEYLAMRVQYGEECWSDPEFVEAYRRDNPWCRVKVTRDTRGNEYHDRIGK